MPRGSGVVRQSIEFFVEDGVQVFGGKVGFTFDVVNFDVRCWKVQVEKRLSSFVRSRCSTPFVEEFGEEIS